MPSPFQKQSQRRKLIYAGAIAVLFTLTLFWRQRVDAQGDVLDLREQNLGEAELTGAVVQLSLTGSRGVAICGLWWMWNDAQKRQEWNELELLTAAITKLQPHFRTPWRFHSWHLAYNVSVECDRVRDKYFYISRGIQLMADGERQNRDNPDLRFEVGYIFHDKFGSSDEQNALRSLFQLSCIPPTERDPDRLRAPDGRVDLAKFQRFCEAHPFLVRRLREHGGCHSPEDVLAYLKENRELPSRYEAGSAGRLKPASQQFPTLPRRGDVARRTEFTADDYSLPDEFDNFKAAQIWMLYAQEPMPEPNPITGESDYDRAKFRMPRRMSSAIIFRQYPAVMQTRLAERLQKEGWFDNRGWVVDEGRQGANRWFPGRQVTIGTDRNWSADAWSKARDLWTDHGQRTGLYLDPATLRSKEKLAQKYRTEYEVAPSELGPEPRGDQSEEMKAAFAAHRQLFRYASDRQVSNFAHFLAQAQAECLPGAIEARRLFHQAHGKGADPSEAIRLYARGFAEWKKMLDGTEDYRRDLDVQEDTYKIQYDYLWLLKDQRGNQLKQLLLAQDLLTQGAARPTLVPLWMPPTHLVHPSKLPPPIVGPFDGNGPDGQPYFSAEAIRRARMRLGLADSAPRAPRKR